MALKHRTALAIRKLSALALSLSLVLSLSGFIFSLPPQAPVSKSATVAPQAAKIAASPQRGALPGLKQGYETPTPASDYSFSDEKGLAETLNNIEPGYGEPLPLDPRLPARKPSLGQKITTVETGILSLLGSQGKPGRAVLQREVSVSRGDTLMDLLVKKASVSNEDAFGAIEALRTVYDPRDLKPGNNVTVLSDMGGTFAGLQIAPDPVKTLTVEKSVGGDFVVNEQKKAVSTDLKGARGQINGSLFESAQAQGLPVDIVMGLIRMYSWSVDFQRDIQPGDQFEVMFEQTTTEDQKTVPGKSEIVYASLVLSGKPYQLYRYEHGSESDFYEPDGKSARKSLMKTPIDGARLSSGYGMRRHPVLGYSKMHKGIDFAAPTGTPIYAAGDGTIEKIGRWSSYGNYIRIRHNNDVKTAYAHMKGFKSGLKSGSRVKQGEVIGYVGTTGRSTGAHLHYEIMMGNAQVNPAKVKILQGNALKGRDLAAFKTIVSETAERFAKLGDDNTSVAAVMTPGLPTTP